VRKYYALVDTNNKEIEDDLVELPVTSTIRELRANVIEAYPVALKDIEVGRLKVI
jgi:hypothetical protein